MRAEFDYLHQQFPDGGLFRDKNWRLSPNPVTLSSAQIDELEAIGRALYAFSRAANALYFSEDLGPNFKHYLDRGKPDWLLKLQSSPTLRDQVPQVIRPDLLLTSKGFRLVEIDSLPGGMGTLDLLHQAYSSAGFSPIRSGTSFTEFFSDQRTQFAFSEEGLDYFPEIQWLANQSEGKCRVHPEATIDPQALASIENSQTYRYFELWDKDLTPEHRQLLKLASEGALQMTPPPKAFLEEKLLLALYWMPGLTEGWKRELAAEHRTVLDQLIPKTWVLDPTPIPETTVQHGTNFWSWEELKDLSIKDRRLVVKISGFSETAWGSRGVHIGHDETRTEWQASVTQALAAFDTNPYLMQPFEDSSKFDHNYYDDTGKVERIESVARFNPYFQVRDGRTSIASVMAVVCPSDKKKIHGMTDASLVPCIRRNPEN